MIRQLEASFCPILNNFEKKYRVARKPARNLRISDGYPLIVRKLQQNKQIVGRVSLRDSAGRSHSHLSSPNGANRSLRLNRAIINNGKGFCSPPAKGHGSGISKIRMKCHFLKEKSRFSGYSLALRVASHTASAPKPRP